MFLALFFFSFRTASLLRHTHYLIPSAYYLLITSSLGLFISLGQLYLVWTIYASYQDLSPSFLPIPSSLYPRMYYTQDVTHYQYRYQQYQFLVRQLPPHVYKLAYIQSWALSLTWFAIQVLQLSPAFSVTSFTISLTLILFTAILTLRLRQSLSPPFGVTFSITLDY